MRAEMNVPPVQALARAAARCAARRAGPGRSLDRGYPPPGACVGRAGADGDVPKGSAQAVLDETTIVLPLEGLIDLAVERARLAKDRDKLVVEARKIRQKLDNADFVSRAKRRWWRRTASVSPASKPRSRGCRRRWIDWSRGAGSAPSWPGFRMAGFSAVVHDAPRMPAWTAGQARHDTVTSSVPLISPLTRAPWLPTI